MTDPADIQPAAAAYVLRTHHRAGSSVGNPAQDFEWAAARLAAPLLALHSGTAKVGHAGSLVAAMRLLTGPGRAFRNLIATGEDVGLPLALGRCLLWRGPQVHIMFHGHHMDSLRFGLMARLLRYSAAVHWHPLSAALGEVLQQRFGIRPAQSHATGHAVDTAFFVPNASSGSGVLSAGLARRDYPTLLQAIAPLGVELRIASGSAWFQEASGLDGTTLPPNITVGPAEGHVGLLKLYQAADFVVVPMQGVGHACGYAVIAEAMACGKAVIASRTGAISDFIVEGETGFLVPPGDVTALRDRLALLSGDAALARRMGDAARRHMMAHFTLDHFTARLAAALA